MKLIPLTLGKFAMVDDEDYEWLNQWKWHAHYNRHGHYPYAQRVFIVNKKLTWRWRGNQQIIFMHRVILNTPAGLFTDHIDRNTLNNQRKNLRICSTSQNSMNSKMKKNNTSGFKGVDFHKRNKRWRVTIQLNEKRYFIGNFKNKIEAAQSYNEAALKYHGEFACLNSIPQVHKCVCGEVNNERN